MQVVNRARISQNRNGHVNQNIAAASPSTASCYHQSTASIPADRRCRRDTLSYFSHEVLRFYRGSLQLNSRSGMEECMTEKALGLMRKTDTVCKNLVFERFSSPLQPDYLQRQKFQICTSDANSERKNARPRALSLIRATAR